ncbi:hypothetical protein P8C59_002754 [Phyllachora maydis]|uniref:Uncharacterized protein n=1 Tax=Phyllachora maydis TaxID=1825666 RepID=A0AAD9MBR6_9PEZI|nr:hypothetical protein P8C59_002754 [Phyllachora maydis]
MPPPPSRQRTFTVVPNPLGMQGLLSRAAADAARARARATPLPPDVPRPMTSKQVQAEYRKRTRQPRLSRAEQRRREAEERERERKEAEREKALGRARAARERKRERECALREDKRKRGLPVVDVRPSQGLLSAFVRGEKRDAEGRQADATLDGGDDRRVKRPRTAESAVEEDLKGATWVRQETADGQGLANDTRISAEEATAVENTKTPTPSSAAPEQQKAAPKFMSAHRTMAAPSTTANNCPRPACPGPVTPAFKPLSTATTPRLTGGGPPVTSVAGRRFLPPSRPQTPQTGRVPPPARPSPRPPPTTHVRVPNTTITTTPHTVPPPLPTSTQLFLLSNSDDILPSPTQEARELGLERSRTETTEPRPKPKPMPPPPPPRPARPPPRPVLPALAPVAATPQSRAGSRRPVPPPPPPPPPTQPLSLPFLSTQDLLFSTQDVREVESRPPAAAPPPLPPPRAAIGGGGGIAGPPRQSAWERAARRGALARHPGLARRRGGHHLGDRCHDAARRARLDGQQRKRDVLAEASPFLLEQ